MSSVPSPFSLMCISPLWYTGETKLLLCYQTLEHFLPVMFVTHEHICRLLHLRSASSNWLSWLVLAGRILLLRCSQLRFLVHYSAPWRPFSVRFTLSSNFSCLDRILHADRAFRRVCALTVPHLVCVCVCVFLFFSSLPFVEVVPCISNFWDYKVRSSEDSSTCVASARVLANLVRQLTGNGTSVFCSTPAYCLTNLASFWFFLVAGNLALFKSFPSSFHRLQGSGATVHASVFQLCPFRVRKGKWCASFPFFFHYLMVVGHSACNFSPFRHYHQSSSR